MAGEHWYNQEGKADYGHDVKTARKRNLVPSVTTILGVLDKPGLNYWKMEGGIITASKMPKKEDEDDKTYSKRIMAVFYADNKAAATGTMLHDFCEKQAAPVPLGFEGVCKLIREYQENNLSRVISEESFSYTDLGFGGRVDCYGLKKDGRRFILDWKSQAPKNGEFTVYDEWVYQLSAYSKGDAEIEHISVIISSDPKTPKIQEHIWTGEEVKDGYEVFNACKLIWQKKNSKM